MIICYSYNHLFFFFVLNYWNPSIVDPAHNRTIPIQRRLADLYLYSTLY